MSPQRKILLNKASAVAWVAFGVLAFVMGWQSSVALVWLASVYANAKTDWGTAEAADDGAVLAELKALRDEVRRLSDRLA